MPGFLWYYNRWKAMDAAERRARLRQMFCRCKDWWTLPVFQVSSGEFLAVREGAFPVIPPREAAPEAVRNALSFDADRIMGGTWTVFRHLGLLVERHPAWQKDYLAGVDLRSIKSSTFLDHRRLPGEADVKVIWEVSRWSHLVRLAQEAYVHNDRWTMKVAIRRVYQWSKKNAPLTGYNWTSALEGGLRLINYCWIDALTEATAANKKLGDEAADVERSLLRLRQAVLPAHVWFVWRYRSFGSSANNHLIGELAGLICALSRWRSLERWAAPLETIQAMWEAEVLKQFAPDGGNREQALNYHLFSFELCWQAYLALKCAGIAIAPETYQRLQRAADFFTVVQTRKEPWDYGDSDDAFVTPLWERENEIPQEWVRWMESPENETCVGYWLGEPPPMSADISSVCKDLGNGWFHFPETGLCTCWQGDWQTRWDLTPHGYLSTAAHGHLDALHLSFWYRERAFIIDPGTGAYFGDLRARTALAGWRSHNGPHIANTPHPIRKGPFLWGELLSKPTFHKETDLKLSATLQIPEGTAKRSITMEPEENSWLVEDSIEVNVNNNTADPEKKRTKNPFSQKKKESVAAASDYIEVCWLFAPETKVEQVDDRSWKITRAEGSAMLMSIGDTWTDAELYEPDTYQHFHRAGDDLRGLCSPSFRTLRKTYKLTLHGKTNVVHWTRIKGL